MNFEHAFVHQNEQELGWLLAKLGAMESFLEIGSAYGHSLAMMAMVGMKGSKVCTIDQGWAWEVLSETIDKLKSVGYDAHKFQGDSTSPEAIAFAEKHGPYDFIFIDGDHSYEGAKADWLNYGRLSKLVGFHDIAHPDHDVSKLWSELKATHKTEECTMSGCMGIGLVYR